MRIDAVVINASPLITLFRSAQTLNIPTLGTGGLLVLAKQRALLHFKAG